MGQVIVDHRESLPPVCIHSAVDDIAKKLGGAKYRGADLFPTLFRIVGCGEAHDVVDAALHREQRVHYVERGTCRSAGVVKNLYAQCRRGDFVAIETIRCREHVERPARASAVDEDDGSGVGGRIIARRDPCLPTETFGAESDCSLIAAEVNVFARERCVSCQVRNPGLLVRGPEVDCLTADQDELSFKVCDLGKDGSNVDVGEFAHSSGFEPRKLTRTLRKTKTPFSRRSRLRLFSPDASARTSSSRERCFSRARSAGSSGSGSFATPNKIRPPRTSCNRTRAPMFAKTLSTRLTTKRIC